MVMLSFSFNVASSAILIKMFFVIVIFEQCFGISNCKLYLDKSILIKINAVLLFDNSISILQILIRYQGFQRDSYNGAANHKSELPLPPGPVRPTEAWRTPPDSPQKYPRPPSPLSSVPTQRIRTPLQVGDGSLKGFRLPSPAFRLPLSNSTDISSKSHSSNHNVHERALPLEDDSGVFPRNINSASRSLKPMTDAKIPFTGDKDTDANIMAFIKARESLMKRKGPNS